MLKMPGSGYRKVFFPTSTTTGSSLAPEMAVGIAHQRAGVQSPPTIDGNESTVWNYTDPTSAMPSLCTDLLCADLSHVAGVRDAWWSPPLADFQSLHHISPFQPSWTPSISNHLLGNHNTAGQWDSHSSSYHEGFPVTPQVSTDSAIWQDGEAQLPGFMQSGPQINQLIPETVSACRFESTLAAESAMIKDPTEAPITYLNRGQTYTISILDTCPAMPALGNTTYRTSVSIAFDDNEKHNSASYWDVWSQRQHTTEAHGGRATPPAIAYVPADQQRDKVGESENLVQLESSLIDRFSVLWVSGGSGVPQTCIALRFNFLSTDFSRCKGVKGMPLQLWLSTSIVSTSTLTEDPNPHVSFCRVQLFRDHGAERKLSLDVAHLNKRIAKLKQKIIGAQSGSKWPRKKPPRTWLIRDRYESHKLHQSMQTSLPNRRSVIGRTFDSIEDELHSELKALGEMQMSRHPVTVLHFKEKGKGLDDPGVPVPMPAQDFPTQPPYSQLVSAHAVTKKGPEQSNRTNAFGKVENLRKPTRVDCTASISHRESSIQTPPQPVACFYISRQDEAWSKDTYYRASYLVERTLSEFNRQIAANWSLDASSILRTVHITQKGLTVEVDDDVVRELKEGQVMSMQVKEIRQPARQKWNTVGAHKRLQSFKSGIVLILSF